MSALHAMATATALDPIFAALDAANTAETAHALACDDLDERDDAAMRACNAACDLAAAARGEVMRTLPVTVGGLRALACHYVRWGETFAEDGFLHIAKSLEGCESKQPLRSLCRAEPEQSQSHACANRSVDIRSERSEMTIPDHVEINTAWNCLPLSLRDRIGFIALDMVFHGFLGGDAYALEDRVLRSDHDRGKAIDRESKDLTELYRVIEDALPDLFGPEGENPAWSMPATAGGARG